MALWGCLVLVACCELAALDCLAFREASLLRQLWHKSIEAWRRTAGLRFGSLVVSLLLLIWAILRQEEFDLDRQAKFFDILLKIVSISGIAAGAVWSFNAFLRQRLAASRLTVKQEIHPIQLPDGRWLLKVHVTVSNVGQVQVTLRRWRLYADQILPLTEDVEKLDLPEGAYTDKQAHWECFKDGDFKDERAFRMLVEPGETDDAIANLVVPSGIQVVQIYSHLWVREDGSSPKGVPSGWPCQTVVDLRVRSDVKGEAHEHQSSTEPTRPTEPPRTEKPRGAPAWANRE